MFKFFLKTFGNLLFFIGLSIAIFTYVPIIYSEARFRLFPPEDYVTIDNIYESTAEPAVVGKYDEPDYTSIVPVVPVDPIFGIIISKINVNAPVVKDVTTVDEKEYMAALHSGVAHARGTALPGEKGNIFMFAHSSLNFWQLGPYATVFNLLNKLDNGDIITVYYEDEAYNYVVFSEEIVPGWDTTPFYQEYDESILTLITCDPPGSTLNRRVIRARLI